MIIACLQVRLKSKRFPKKAMVNVKNKPLFLHVAERINSSKKVDKLIICTSKNKQDLPIIDVCKKQNIEYFAGEEDDVVKRYIDAVSKYEPDHIVRVTGDNPCVSFEFIDLAIKEHLSKNSKYTTTDDLPRGMRSEIIDFNFLRNLHVKLVDPAMTEYMSWYLDRPDKWKVVKVNMPQKLKRSHYRLTVDKKIDLDVIKKVYDVLYKGTPIDSYKIVKFLDENQDVVMLNSSIKQRLHNDLKDKVDIRTFDEVS
tara:strand:+ start:670 stop:1431 length:762 start_codon:yes stop_codon:yes gene_type:complete